MTQQLDGAGDRNPHSTVAPAMNRGPRQAQGWVGGVARRQPALSEVEGRGRLAPAHVVRLLKFNFVGTLGIAIQLAAISLFRAALHLNYVPATVLAVETAVLHNFLWHERFTWQDRPAATPLHSLARLARFNATNGAVSILGNLAVMRLLAGYLRIHYLVANLIAVAICSLANYLLSDRLVFREATGGESPGSLVPPNRA